MLGEAAWRSCMPLQRDVDFGRTRECAFLHSHRATNLLEASESWSHKIMKVFVRLYQVRQRGGLPQWPCRWHRLSRISTAAGALQGDEKEPR